MERHGTRIILLMAASLSAACAVEILHDADEATANEVLAALQRSGIEGDKSRDTQGNKPTYTVAVPRSATAEAWRVLRAGNLPRPKRQGLGEVFGNTGLVPTATQERALMHHALAGELSRTLESIEGVLEARVHLVLTSRAPLSPPDAPVSPAKASVLLRLAGEPPLDEKQVQRLVAGSVKDLAPERVSVVLVHQKVAAAPAADRRVTSVGPFRVAPDSRGLLVSTLVLSLVLVALLGGGTFLLLRRVRRLAASLEQVNAEQPAGTSPRLEGSLGLIERSLSGRSRRRATGEGKGSS